MYHSDVLIIGAGAAGLMCAIEAAKRKRSVLVIDHANKAGKKILMSGGGRCNFTNYNVSPEQYLSHNPHFFKSALSRYTQWDFLELVQKYGIAFHEKKYGQLFCDNSAKDIVNMLLSECQHYGVIIQLNTHIASVENINDCGFKINTAFENYTCNSLVIATGGLSIPTMGASAFGYQIATQFGIKVWPTRASLVPLTLQPQDKERFAPLSGVSVECIVSSQKKSFHEDMLFTHRGLSGPAILQISNYWEPGHTLHINILPNFSLLNSLKETQKKEPKLSLKEFLGRYLPKRVVSILLNSDLEQTPLHATAHSVFEEITERFQNWRIKPNGTEGYRTAEVTLGGVDCHAISSKTMEANAVKGLYFIGEVLDVTGWLGGYNFQWAWSSGWVAGQVV